MQESNGKRTKSKEINIRLAYRPGALWSSSETPVLRDYE